MFTISTSGMWMLSLTCSWRSRHRWVGAFKPHQGRSHIRPHLGVLRPRQDREGRGLQSDQRAAMAVAGYGEARGGVLADEIDLGQMRAITNAQGTSRIRGVCCVAQRVVVAKADVS